MKSSIALNIFLCTFSNVMQNLNLAKKRRENKTTFSVQKKILQLPSKVSRPLVWEPNVFIIRYIQYWLIRMRLKIQSAWFCGRIVIVIISRIHDEVNWSKNILALVFIKQDHHVFFSGTESAKEDFFSGLPVEKIERFQ